MKNYLTLLALCLLSLGTQAFAQNNEIVVEANCFEIDAKSNFSQEVVVLRSTRDYAEAAISIKLTNIVTVYSITFDLELPRGVEYVKNFKYGERIPYTKLGEKAKDGDWVLYHGDKYNNFILTGLGEIGSEGEILQLNLKVKTDMPTGRYPIRLKSFRTFGGYDFLDDHKVGDIVAYLEVDNNKGKSYFQGNAYNKDRVLDVKDPAAAADMILKKETPNNESDVNWDGQTTIVDLVNIIELVKKQN